MVDSQQLHTIVLICHDGHLETKANLMHMRMTRLQQSESHISLLLSRPYLQNPFDALATRKNIILAYASYPYFA